MGTVAGTSKTSVWATSKFLSLGVSEILLSGAPGFLLSGVLSGTLDLSSSGVGECFHRVLFYNTSFRNRKSVHPHDMPRILHALSRGRRTCLVFSAYTSSLCIRFSGRAAIPRWRSPRGFLAYQVFSQFYGRGAPFGSDTFQGCWRRFLLQQPLGIEFEIILDSLSRFEIRRAFNEGDLAAFF